MMTESKDISIPEEVRLENVACPLGCDALDDFVFSGRDRLHNLPGVFNIVKCRGCGLMRTNPRPTSDTIGFYYPNAYGPYKDTCVQQANEALRYRVKQIPFKVLRVLMQTHAQAIPKIRAGRMLEIGCASGSFLHGMARKGWQVEGIEFSEKAAQAAAKLGYRVHAGPLETAPKPHDPFDLIVGWMVLEHLHDPLGCLRKLREWAKPGAWLVLSVPNSGSMEFRLIKEKLYALHLPNHLYHFTPQTFRHVLQASGWKLEKVHHQRVLSNLVASVGNFLEDRYQRSALSAFLKEYPRQDLLWHAPLYPFAFVLAMLGQTGRMTVWARKQ